MTESAKLEFQTVDLVVGSEAETRAVDAFVLTVVKAERQLRKLVTHLIFQFPCFGYGDIDALQEALAQNRDVYFDGFERGFDALYPKSVRELIGFEYGRYQARLAEATRYRNKIFHGQLTLASLTREELLLLVKDIRAWCDALAEAAEREIGFDGFARDSFRKSDNVDLISRLRINLRTMEDYVAFIRDFMQRR